MEYPINSEPVETDEIVSAYVSNNTLTSSELIQLIGDVHSAVTNMSANGSASNADGNGGDLQPAVPVSRSIQPDYLICLENGLHFKSLKKHLRTHYDLSPEEYRAKWKLPSDYPMVCPNYAKHRSKLAKKIGLGKR